MEHVLSDEIVEALRPIRSIKDTLNRGERKDGRSLNKFRKPTISCDVFPEFDGSASVGVDGTCVMVGVTGMVHSTEHRSVVVRVTKSLFAKEQSLDGEMSSLVASLERLINGAIDFSALQAGENLFWSLELDVQVLESNGPVLPLALLGCLAALLSTRLPAQITRGKDLKVRADLPADSKGGAMLHLPLIALPVVASFAAHQLADKEEGEDEEMKASATVESDKQTPPLPPFRWIPDPSAIELASAHVAVSALAQSPLPFDKDAPPAFDRCWSLSAFEDKRARLAAASAIARLTNKDGGKDNNGSIRLLAPEEVAGLLGTDGALWSLAEREAESQVSALRKACKSYFKAGAKGQMKRPTTQ